MACKSASASTTARLTPRRTAGWSLMDAGSSSVRRSLTPLHHVEHRADDRRVLAKSVDAGSQRKNAMDRRQPPVLAGHVVGGRGDRPERRPADDEVRAAEPHLIRQVRVSTRKLRDLHGLAKVELRDVRRGPLISQPRLQSRPVELFTGADGFRVRRQSHRGGAYSSGRSTRQRGRACPRLRARW